MVLPDTIAHALHDGAIAVMPTDTIYGIVTSAWDKASVERIYALKKRSPEKPCIILLHSAKDMRAFGVENTYIQKVTSFATPDPTSFIVPIERTDLDYLDRGTGTLAFRIPASQSLHDFLAISGPLIAPSANTEGNPPATTVAEARDYFGGATSYVDDGPIIGTPSALIDIATGVKLR